MQFLFSRDQGPMRIGFTFALLSLLPLFLFAPALAAEWQGRSVEREGVIWIENPLEPMEPPLTLTPEKLWRIGGATDNDDEFFGFIGALDFDAAGNIYLLDIQLHQIKVFSPDGEYLRTIGREGEGPGEFRRPTGLYVRLDGTVGVLQRAPGRLVQLDPQGKPLPDFPLPPPEGEMHVLVSGRGDGEDLVLVLGNTIFEPGKVTSERTLVRVDSASRITAEYTTGIRIRDMETRLVDETMWGNGFESNFQVGPDGRVYAGETWGDYRISTWAASGGDKRVIARALEPRKRTEEELEEVRELMQVFINHFPGAKPIISDYSPLIFSFLVRDNGSVWVVNDYDILDIPDDVMGVYDLFDDQGHYRRQVTLKGETHPLNDTYVFHGDRLYVLRGALEAAVAREGGGADVGDDGEEPEPMSLVCYRLDYVVD
ncbi:MAG: 6-bladed beta-propeller [bacterium]|nr:6-bladed beta-propeller [bacterium]